MSITSLLMTLENSSPESIRVVNLSDDTPLDVLTGVVETAFGFSGGEPGKWVTGRMVHTNGTVDRLLNDLGLTGTFTYGDDGRWSVRVEALGAVAEETPSPLLIEATGPDAVESCDGPGEMTRLRAAVRGLLAGVDQRPSDMIAMYHHLPHLTPPQMLQRLTTVDPVAVAERMAHRVPPTFLDEGDLSFDDLVEGLPGGEPSADVQAFLDFVSTRPDLQQILDNDPDASSNRKLQQAIEDFFGAPETDAPAPDVEWARDLPEVDEQAAEVLTEAMRWLLDFIGEGRPITQSGYLKPADLKVIAEHLRISEYWDENTKREMDTLPVLTLRRAMEYFELLEIRGSRIFVTDLGRELKDRPLELVRHVVEHLPLIHHPDELAPMATRMKNWLDGTDSPVFPFPPTSYADNQYLFLAMNALVHERNFFATQELTEEGMALVGEIFRRF